jgi:hypothetical protein
MFGGAGAAVRGRRGEAGRRRGRRGDFGLQSFGFFEVGTGVISGAGCIPKGSCAPLAFMYFIFLLQNYFVLHQIKNLDLRMLEFSFF